MFNSWICTYRRKGIRISKTIFFKLHFLQIACTIFSLFLKKKQVLPLIWHALLRTLISTFIYIIWFTSTAANRKYHSYLWEKNKNVVLFVFSFFDYNLFIKTALIFHPLSNNRLLPIHLILNFCWKYTVKVGKSCRRLPESYLLLGIRGINDSDLSWWVLFEFESIFVIKGVLGLSLLIFKSYYVLKK